MTDKYKLQQTTTDKYILWEREIPIADINCRRATADLIDKCLNQTSRAGSKTSQAKRDAAKRNIQKRWERNETAKRNIVKKWEK